MIGVNVAQLLHAPVGTTRSYPLDEHEPELARELGLLTPIVGTLKLTRTNHGILADAWTPLGPSSPATSAKSSCPASTSPPACPRTSRPIWSRRASTRTTSLT
jgi:hypothetical protein